MSIDWKFFWVINEEEKKMKNNNSVEVQKCNKLPLYTPDAPYDEFVDINDEKDVIDISRRIQRRAPLSDELKWEL